MVRNVMVNFVAAPDPDKRKEIKKMPIYEYQCTQCGKKFEALRSISVDDSELKCPKCGAEHPQRAISMFTTSGSSGGTCTPASSG